MLEREGGNVIYFRASSNNSRGCRVRNFRAGTSTAAEVEGKLRTRRKIERLQVHRRYEYVIGRGKSASPVYRRPTFEYWNPIQIQVERVAMKIHSRPDRPPRLLARRPSPVVDDFKGKSQFFNHFRPGDRFPPVTFWLTSPLKYGTRIENVGTKGLKKKGEKK